MAAADSGNLFQALPSSLAGERVDELLSLPGLRVERIISTGQATPEGQWYDSDNDEWVVLLRGAAGLRFEDEVLERSLAPGDWLLIRARRRHRVTWTAADQPTVWLAVHGDANNEAG